VCGHSLHGCWFLAMGRRDVLSLLGFTPPLHRFGGFRLNAGGLSVDGSRQPVITRPSNCRRPEREALACLQISIDTSNPAVVVNGLRRVRSVGNRAPRKIAGTERECGQLSTRGRVDGCWLRWSERYRLVCDHADDARRAVRFGRLGWAMGYG